MISKLSLPRGSWSKYVTPLAFNVHMHLHAKSIPDPIRDYFEVQSGRGGLNDLKTMQGPDCLIILLKPFHHPSYCLPLACQGLVWST